MTAPIVTIALGIIATGSGMWLLRSTSRIEQQAAKEGEKFEIEGGADMARGIALSMILSGFGFFALAGLFYFHAPHP